MPTDVGAAILEELRALRELVQEQNRRIAELEEAVRTGRELGPAAAEQPREEDRGAAAEASGVGDTVPVRPAETFGPAPATPSPGGTLRRLVGSLLGRR